MFYFDYSIQKLLIIPKMTILIITSQQILIITFPIFKIFPKKMFINNLTFLLSCYLHICNFICLFSLASKAFMVLEIRPRSLCNC